MGDGFSRGPLPWMGGQEKPLIDKLFLHTRGPSTAKVLLIGEAWGREELAAGKPFMGQSGRELDRMLRAAGFSTEDVLFTNVVHAHPPNNDFTEFFLSSKDKNPTYLGLKCKPILKESVNDLVNLIEIVRPKLIIMAGNIPFWALFHDKVSISTKEGFKIPSGISTWRGSELSYRFTNGETCTALPIIHPTAILRNWDLRHVTVHDLRRGYFYFTNKKKTWGNFPVVAWHKPTYEQTIKYLQAVNDNLATQSSYDITLDIETYRRRDLACIGISVDPETFPTHIPNNLCIPFFFFNEKGDYTAYWSIQEELSIILMLRSIFTHKACNIIGQNWSYDAYFFFSHFFLYSPPKFDTMLAQHVMFPGTRKSLDYLASLYLDDYVYWKDESEDWNEPGAHETLWLYNCRDCEATRLIAKAQRAAIKQLNLNEQLEFLLESWETAFQMTLNGMLFDNAERNKMRLALIDRAGWLQERLTFSVPEFARYSTTGKLWFNSPKETMNLFYGTLGLTPIQHKKTKMPTVDATALPILRQREPLLTQITLWIEELRSIEVFISHFLDVKLASNSRIHYSFNVGGTVTFRWSSQATPTGLGTNMQNLPKGDD